MPNLISGPRKQAPSPAPPMGGVGNIFEGESDALMRIGGELRRSGNVLAGAFERRRYIQGVDEYQQAQMALEQKMAKSAENRMLDQNFDTQPKRFRAEMDQWYQSYEFKSNSARKRFRNYYGMNTAREELNIFKAATVKKLNRIDDDQTAMQDINTRNYLNITGEGKEADQARSDLLVEYSKSLDGHVKAGTMSPARVDQHKRAWAILLAEKVIKRQPELTAEMLATDSDVDMIVPAELREFLKPGDEDHLWRTAENEVRKHKFQVNEEEETKKAEYQLEVAKIAQTGDVNAVNAKLNSYFNDRAIFSDGSTVADWRYEELGKASRAVNILTEDKKDPYTTITNKPVYWSNFKKVLENPDSMTKLEITSMVPEICGMTQAQSILNLKKSPEDNPLKSPQAIKYLKGIEAMHTDKDGVLDIFKFDRDTRRMTEHIENNPKDTPEQLYQFYKTLVEEPLKHWIWRALESIRGGVTPTPNRGDKIIATRGKLDKATGGDEKDIKELTDEELRAIIEGG